MRIEIQERAEWSGVKAGDRTIENVLILRTPSQGGKRAYSMRALEQLADLARGARIFADHSNAGRGPRPVRDLLGSVQSARVAGNEVRGDITYLRTSADLFESLVETRITGVGLSVNAFGTALSDPAIDGQIVEEIEELHSIDLVSDAGSVSNLFESMDTEEPKNDAEYRDAMRATLEPTSGRRDDTSKPSDEPRHPVERGEYHDAIKR